jgi:tRNA pseudouridine55 synthase
MDDRDSGVIVVDKPVGMTSARVVAVVKRLFKARKVGHTGTLDPAASGILICCVNRATRLAAFFLKGRKTYEATLRLGVTTDTQDAAGNITGEKDPSAIRRQDVVASLMRFKGRIEQKPPVFSALKHRGVPLYKLARAGKAVEKPARQIQIHALDLLEVNVPEVRFRVTCSAGTYIRTLCHDLGEALGCGGHLAALRRTESGGFTLADACTLEEIQAAADAGNLSERLIGMADALRTLPALAADGNVAEKVRFGRQLALTDLGPDSAELGPTLFKIVDAENRLLAVATREGENGGIDYCCVFSA